VALKVCLVSSDGTISARRIKADDCFLSAKGIEMLSSLEVAKLRCEAGQLGLIVRKRLGVGNFAEIISEGPIKLGSLFSNLAIMYVPRIIDGARYNLTIRSKRKNIGYVMVMSPAIVETGLYPTIPRLLQ
jgi:hypothetical protein